MCDVELIAFVYVIGDPSELEEGKGDRYTACLRTWVSDSGTAIYILDC
jgi:hypothetical protein